MQAARIVCTFSDVNGSCSKTATYGIRGQQTTHCRKHAPAGTVPLKYKTCTHTGCLKVPNYGMPGSKPTFCKTHKTEDMIDVKMPKCTYECSEDNQVIRCTKQGNFGLPGQRPTRCLQHKTTDMVDVKMPRCKFSGCFSQPTHGHPLHKPTHCGTHAESQMINITSPKCKSDLCSTSANRKYDGYCAYCFGGLFPDDTRARNLKIREKQVIDRLVTYIDNRFQTFADKSHGESRKRPDLLIVLDALNIIVEVDENQHKGYEQECEMIRLYRILEDLKDKPLVVIRFNPDSYKIGNIKHKSAFKEDRRSGVLVPDPKEFKTRMNTLIQKLDYWLAYKPTEPVELKVEYLYYDQVPE